MNTEFIEFLKQQIGQKSLGQIEILTGISKSYLSKVLRGQRETPKPSTLKKLSKALPCSYEELLKKAVTTKYADVLNNDENLQNKNLNNTIIVFGRGTGREEYHMSDEQIKLLKSLIENMKDAPDVDKF